MTKIQIILDTTMCFLWVVTYTLVLIGTVKYRYPLISLNTQAIIAPFEFSVLFLFLKIRSFRFDYASMAYLYWGVIEVLIFLAILKSGHLKKKHIIPYVMTVVAFTGTMIYWVTIREYMFMFSWLNTTVGIVFWLIYVIRQKDFPMNSITLAIFVIKFLADVLAFIVYYQRTDWTINLAILPALDFMFFPVFFIRRRKQCVD